MKNKKKNPFTNNLASLLSDALRKVIITFMVCQLAMPQSIFAGDISDDENLLEQQENCTGDSVEWNSELNSCTTKVEAEEAKDQSEACANSDDPDTCYLTNAEGLTGVSAGDNIDSKSIENVGKVVAAAYAAFGLIAFSAGVDGTGYRLKTKKAPACMSGRLFQYTSVAWIAGDYFLKSSAKKKFEEIAEKYEKEAANDELKGTEEGSYQAQVRAFEYLKEEQENVKDQADKRKLLQLAVIAGYTAATGFGAAEMMSMATKCKETKGDDAAGDEVDSTPDTDTPEADTASTSEPDVGSEDTPMQPDASAEATQAAESKFGAIKKLVGTSLGNTIAGATMIALNAYLIYHAISEKSKAGDNIKSIEEVLASYSEYMSGYCPDGRDDVTNASCYCYNSDGTQNDNRTSSVICQNLYAANNVDYSAQKELDTTVTARQGCVTVTGQFDIDCKCRNMTNTTSGQNACATVSSLSTSTNGFTSALDIPDAINTANSLTNGTSAALANLNSASLSASAAKNKRFTDKLLDSAKKNKLNIPNSSQLDSMVGTKLRESASTMPTSSSSSLGGLSSNSAAMPASVETALEKAKESEVSAAAGALLSSLSNGSGSIGSKSAKSNSFVWNDSASGSGGKVQTFMEKKYKYKNSDIVNRKDVSLWNVISKRYQTSGIKRLFADEDDE